MSETQEVSTTRQSRDIARELLEAMTPKHSTVTGGEWDSKNRTYTIKDIQSGIVTRYRLVFLPSDMTSGNVEHIVTEHYQVRAGADGQRTQVEVIKDLKTGEWRKPTLADKIFKYTKAMFTTGHIAEERSVDGNVIHKLNIIERDTQRPPPTIIHV